ncbi:MAG TPA: TIM barrel protein [Steroidobacteraceae bacterium]|nr:TIM barrel protein [Steroidobacteraceae bacterium]
MTDRRKFMTSSSAALAAGLIASGAARAANKARRPAATAGKRAFQCRYAPHFGMFKESAGADIFAQLDFMADQGFTALEDNGLMARPVEEQARIGETLRKRGMTMGVFVIDGGDNWKTSLATGKAEFRDKFLATCRTAVEVAKRVDARWATVVPGYFERKLPMGIQTGNVIDILRAGVEILEPAKLTMVLEPLSDNPDLFLRTSDQAYAICRAVDSPSCKILYDMYHMQRNEGDMVAHIDHAWSEIAYFQIGDNPGRKEPGTGELNYRNLFRHIRQKGYDGVFGMEHGNSKPGKDGEQALIDAYVAADSFELGA